MENGAGNGNHVLIVKFNAMLTCRSEAEVSVEHFVMYDLEVELE